MIWKPAWPVHRQDKRTRLEPNNNKKHRLPPSTGAPGNLRHVVPKTTSEPHRETDRGSPTLKVPDILVKYQKEKKRKKKENRIFGLASLVTPCVSPHFPFHAKGQASSSGKKCTFRASNDVPLFLTPHRGLHAQRILRLPNGIPTWPAQANIRRGFAARRGRVVHLVHGARLRGWHLMAVIVGGSVGSGHFVGGKPVTKRRRQRSGGPFVQRRVRRVGSGWLLLLDGPRTNGPNGCSWGLGNALKGRR